ncbi:RNA-splicing ligase [Brevibacterium phage 4C]|uniref:3'-phosphate/5'-hydroxy nucleic acid ligase n=31 Tax=Agmunavirus AGM1 TaxID=2843882 RepID=A0A7D0KJ73_9CAUD|nr:tRNA splicing ligase [Brevibacterium phage AGM1]QDH85692.1 RNA-splicing ligase [Brevibacterium phage AGM2]QDH85745.1 RNA-splicing ligase [Brevibacterium phage AGM3]QDH85798.1 RNA-splicing ligase [Brevibacterium phage AGM4]QDH85851.1 RNA-splicing ligase [Brevibacterium phage AGM5]QDH85904.1 RNA-splicing ligase [Brevibacterium phage AGM6]QDH85957.1 RNA-splicing ligase [Brevibacterium phage AGM7]QDH86010.1 RNA-splicing ligase [Brevibacterium phage AGM8]QDH86063.1 RNA-splicing ligase [Brevib
MTIKQIAPKLYNWASILEHDTEAQALTTSTMPFVHPHLALMPDAHLGKGATVGSVIPTDRAIIPAAVGVDIGCGMIAVRTQWTDHDLYNRDGVPGIRRLREDIEQRIPLSAGNYNTELTQSAQKRVEELEDIWDSTCANFGVPWADEYATNWQHQLGTLGSGNHFIEITVDEEQRVWAFLHSGSRDTSNGRLRSAHK